MIRILLCLVCLHLLCGQADVPADSILAQAQTGLFKKTAIYPIKLWQELSYSSDHMGCQFEPSCSQFMALSIAHYGVLRGVIVGSDRILRCNPAALTYHLETADPRFTSDGRLIDPIKINPTNQTQNNPRIALALSVIPGLGRLYAGHGLDGFISFSLIGSLGYASYTGFQNGNQITPSLLGAVALTFWLADFYGAYRSALQSKK